MELIVDPVLPPLPHAEYEALRESIRSPGPGPMPRPSTSHPGLHFVGCNVSRECVQIATRRAAEGLVDASSLAG